MFVYFNNDGDANADYGRENAGPIYETAPAGHPMEVLRDSYMLHGILEAKAAGYRVAGLGDKHRENLERALKRLAPVSS